MSWPRNRCRSTKRKKGRENDQVNSLSSSRKFYLKTVQVRETQMIEGVRKDKKKYNSRVPNSISWNLGDILNSWLRKYKKQTTTC